MGPLVIGHGSALEYWNAACRRTGDVSALGNAASRRRDTAAACAALARGEVPQLRDASLAPAGCSLPLQVTVTEPAARPRGRNLVGHVRVAEVPVGAFVQVGPDMFASSPEFAFTQMADELTLVELMALAHELCGTYARLPEGELLLGCPPLTSTAKLARFIDSSSGFRGRDNAVRTVEYLFDGAATPQQAQVLMLLCLPYLLGGFYLPRPKVNERVGMASWERGQAAFYVCDLYWPEARLEVACGSETDPVRQAALERTGIRTVRITDELLRDPAQFKKTARALARALGKRLRYHDPEFSQAHDELRRELGLPNA